VEGLRELGYVDGQSIVLDPRGVGERHEQLPGLAADLLRRQVDVILALGAAAAIEVVERRRRFRS
jgi:putative ABC transport system substrate-binding protein